MSTRRTRRRVTAERRLPGDLTRTQLIERMIRVDQAGESGATRIYAGQLAVLGRRTGAETIRRMAAQEDKHRATFDRLMTARRVRPTLLSPLWSIAGFALGAGTAVLGEKAALACTVAVEEVIDAHYTAQAAELGDDEAELRAAIEEARADERAHRDAALADGAESAPGYSLLKAAIGAGSRFAIWLSERL